MTNKMKQIYLNYLLNLSMTFSQLNDENNSNKILKLALLLSPFDPTVRSLAKKNKLIY